MKNVYATIFTKTKNGVLVEVPDMGILTEGESMVDAIEMARDAIGIKGIAMEDLGEKIPESSEVINVKKGVFAAEGISTVSLVDVDFGIYRKMQDNKMVCRNVTLPNWLNQAAEQAKVNVSKVLQEALIERLQVRI